MSVSRRSHDWSDTLWPGLCIASFTGFIVPELIAWRADPDVAPGRVTFSRALERWWGVKPRSRRRYVVYAGLAAGLTGLIVHVESLPELIA